MNRNNLQSVSITYAIPVTRQRGASLLVVMVLLLVSALLGISTMEDSSVTSKLTYNEQYRKTVFRAAEGKSSKMFNTANLSTLIGSSSGALSDSTGIASNVDTEARLTLEGIGLAHGYSLGEGVSGFALYNIRSSVTATLAGVHASSTVVQGAQQYAPK